MNTRLSPQLSGFLDTVRWLAALCVVLQHIRYLWFAEYVDVDHKSLLIKIFYFITGFGSEAVLVFFVLSGFLVGGGALKKYQNNNYFFKEYMISRFSRIYTVLIPALICGGLLDWLGLHYFNTSEIYTNSPAYHSKCLNFYITNNLNFETFFLNLANLQTILTAPFGSNGPLWSLAYEWWFYCLFGVFLKFFTNNSTNIIYWLLIAIFVYSLIYISSSFIIFMAIWMLGVAIAMIDPKRFRVSPTFGCIIFIGLLICSRLTHILVGGSIHDSPSLMAVGIVRDFSLAAGFSLWIISIHNLGLRKFKVLQFHKHMADFSYTIYLMHVPLLVFITAILSSKFNIQFFVQPNSKVFLISAVILVIIYIVLFFFSRVTEKFTPNFKSYMISLTSLKHK